jgi:hypothetical protein
MIGGGILDLIIARTGQFPSEIPDDLSDLEKHSAGERKRREK